MIVPYNALVRKLSTSQVQRRGAGRPREFDMESAVDLALPVFRERGYHAASLADLSSAMRLTVGSIYKAFSDKRAIFLAAIDRYTDLRSAQLRQFLDAENNGYEKIRAMLRYYAESAYGAEGQRGCLIVGGATEIATFDPEMASRVTRALERVEVLLRRLILLGKSDGSIPRAIDVDACARTLLCLVQGFRVIGKIGRSRAEMIAAADQALRLLA